MTARDPLDPGEAETVGPGNHSDRTRPRSRICQALQ